MEFDWKLPKEQEFILHLINNNYSNHTVENYKRDLDIFKLFLEFKGIKFTDINKLQLNEYKGYLRTSQHLLDIDKKYNTKRENPENLPQISEYEKSSQKGSKNGKSKTSGLISRSVNRMLSSLRSYLSFLIDVDEVVPISPSAIKLIRTEKTEKQVADFDELVELIEYPEKIEIQRNIKYRNRAILELLFSTGMRISELINLDIANIKTDPARKLILDPKLFIMGKGKKQRFIYLTHRAISFIERYLSIREDEFPALFLPYKGTRKNQIDKSLSRISSRYVQDMIGRYKKMLGIIVPTTPHSLRHGFATYLAEQGANPAAIQRLLGHESLQTTTRYVHASDKFAEESHKEFHPLQD